MPCFLALLDTDEIKHYIFATNKLREIRGASGLLDDLNCRRTEALIELHHGDKIHVGGGGASVLFNSQENAEAFVRDVQALYQKDTLIASITGIVEQWANGEGFGQAWERAGYSLRRKKDSQVIDEQLVTSPFFFVCQHCGHYAASQVFHVEEERALICNACYIKANFTRRLPIHGEFLQQLGIAEGKEENLFPRSLADIGACSQPPGYLGVIFCDGNRMGEHFAHLREQRQVQAFSNAIQEVTRQTVLETLQSLFPKPEVPKPEGEQQIFPFEFVLLGGDDMMLLLPGDRAVPFAAEFLDAFEKGCSRRIADLPPLDEASERKAPVSMSAGIVVAQDSYPLFALVQMADDLLKSAKRRSFEIWQTERREASVLDYQVLTTPSANPLKQLRKDEYEYVHTARTLRLTRRPYTIPEVSALLRTVSQLRKACLPSNKLYALYRLLWQGYQQSQLEFLLLRTRLPEQAERNLLEALESLHPQAFLGMPLWEQWREGHYSTGMVDALELLRLGASEECEDVSDRD